MIALQFAEKRLTIDFVFVYDCPGIGCCPAPCCCYRKIREWLVGHGEMIDFLTGRLATTATYAARHIVQHAKAVFIIWESMGGSFGNPCGAYGRGHASCSKKGKKFSTVHFPPS